MYKNVVAILYLYFVSLGHGTVIYNINYLECYIFIVMGLMVILMSKKLTLLDIFYINVIGKVN